jgi:hypothetical protein
MVHRTLWTIHVAEIHKNLEHNETTYYKGRVHSVESKIRSEQRKRTKTGNSTTPKLGKKAPSNRLPTNPKKNKNLETAGQRQAPPKATSTHPPAKLGQV